MFLLKDKLRQVMASKHLNKNMIGSIALNTARRYFGFTSNPLLLDGYVKFDKLFLKSSEQHIKIRIFQEKMQILKEINDALDQVGYKNQIKEIFLK